MKQSVLLIALAVFGFTLTNAQSSCPVIVTSSLQYKTNPTNACSRQVTFNYYNPTNGSKGISVVVKVKNDIVINDQIDLKNQQNVIKTYTSNQFTACNLADVIVEITPTTTGNGGSSACSATLRSVGGAPLPVTFGTFTAVRNHATISLKWETQSESNNTGFSVERYNNAGNNWETIAFIPSLSSNGNSSTKLSYQYNDNNDSKNITQYRIRQTDFDGKSSYSEIRAVQGQNQSAQTVVFPNPSNNGKVTVVYPDATARNITLYDMTGRSIKDWKNFSISTLQIDNLKTGMYILRSADSQNNDADTQRIVVRSN